jgi:GntR family transcriptional regulator
MGRQHAYERLADEFTRELIGGFWQDGDPLPSENALARAYRVSRRTVRQALELLQREGIISKGQGRSTIYRERAISRDGARLLDFTTAAREAGFTPSTRLVSTSLRASSLSEAHALALDLDEPVWEVRRTRLLDGRPVVYQTSLLPGKLAGRLDLEKLAGMSLYGFLRSALRDNLFVAREEISLLTATSSEAAALSVPTDTPLLRLQRLVVDSKGRPVEYSDSALQASFFRL